MRSLNEETFIGLKLYAVSCNLLALFFGSPLLEALDASGLVEHAVLARVERVALGGDFHDELRVLFPFVFRHFRGADGGTDQKLRARGKILEHDVAVVSRVNVFLHVGQSLTQSTRPRKARPGALLLQAISVFFRFDQ